MIKRPPVALSFVLYPSGGGGGVAPAGSVSGIHSADTTRRGAPSMRTVKSAGVRFASGFPRSSTTLTSSEVTSIDAWKLGFGGCCCADTKKEPQRTQRAERNIADRRSPIGD